MLFKNMKLIGRIEEGKELNRLYESDSPEFIAVFGRRRVGKTFLINELFSTRFSFKFTALSPIDENSETKITTKDQLKHFKEALHRYGYTGKRRILDWFDAFYALEEMLEIYENERMVVFIDELPWLDSKGSKFVSALEMFWNSWGNCHNLMLIICGSANSWMTKKILNNYGGLYNRITYEIELYPFTLKECESFFKERNINLSRYDITQTYMVLGGIPYYLERIEGRLSFAQNIDRLFFKKTALLKREFDNLFKSTFKNYELISKIVRLLFKKSIGYTRSEIASLLNLEDGEALGNAFNAITSSGFVIKYRPLIGKEKKLYYKLVDPFCLFYLRFIDGNTSFDEHMFERNYSSQKVSTWRGLMFENICFKHIEQIKNALNIKIVSSETYPFIFFNEGKIESQIDLIIDRKDNIVNLCEAKFYCGEYLLTKDDYLKLIHKNELVSLSVNKRKVVSNVLITTFALKKNEYSSIYNNVVTLDDLFQ